MQRLVLAHPWISSLLDQDFSGVDHLFDLVARALRILSASVTFWRTAASLAEARAVQTRGDEQFRPSSDSGGDVVE